jgi:hypothetical protein
VPAESDLITDAGSGLTNLIIAVAVERDAEEAHGWIEAAQPTYHRSVIVLKQSPLSLPLDDIEDERPA